MIKNIVLIGMPGSGKSTIGPLLSHKLEMSFVDMDKYIEETENRTIKDMFEISEDFFRDAETRCSRSLSSLRSHVIACGGGIVKRKENIRYFKEGSVIVFINRPLENILADVDTDSRPLLAGGRERLINLYNERFGLYKEYCDIEVINAGEIDNVITEIIGKLKEYGNV